MHFQNRLEKDEHGRYKTGNIKRLSVFPNFVEVYTRNGELIKYKRGGEDESRK